MKISENGLSFIRREEGERLMAYADVIGVWTIGVGHTGTVDGISITKGMTITAEKSRVLMIADVAKFEAAINRLGVIFCHILKILDKLMQRHKKHFSTRWERSVYCSR